jgi:hypothetical protein
VVGEWNKAKAAHLVEVNQCACCAVASSDQHAKLLRPATAIPDVCHCNLLPLACSL